MKQEQNGKQKRFLVLDGSSLIFRAFYALPGLSDSHGQPTGAIFGFSNMLTKLMAEQQPDLMVLAFDKSRHTFRTERYADYKGTRDKTPEELLSQFPLLREFAANMGIPFLEKDNYEADDIIGTLATQAAAKGYDVRVITGDRDALQLVRPNLRVLLTKKGISEIKDYDTAAFEEEYGFEPLKLIDLKGLMGDTSDNIPGVPGVGPKTASKLLLAYGSVENVLAHVGEVSGKKLKENLQTYADQARLSKELATIELHVPDLAFAEEDYRIPTWRRCRPSATTTSCAPSGATSSDSMARQSWRLTSMGEKMVQPHRTSPTTSGMKRPSRLRPRHRISPSRASSRASRRSPRSRASPS